MGFIKHFTDHNNMNYIQIYALRYGRAPEAEIDILHQASLKSGEYTKDNFDASVLGDLLGDSGDPREHIIRRDLELRGATPDDYSANIKKLTGVVTQRVGPTHFYPSFNAHHMTSVRLMRNPHTKELLFGFATRFGDRGDQFPGEDYYGVFKEDEGRQLLKQLQDNGFLDPNWSPEDQLRGT